MKNNLFTIVAFLLLFDTTANSQKQLISTESWLKDATTFQLSNRHLKEGKVRFRNSFNGVRVVFEPQMGFLSQERENRIIVENFTTLNKFGFETNLYKNAIALQFLYIAPSKVQLDEKSQLRKENLLNDPDGKISADYGLSLGLSFLDGIFTIGYGGIFYDRRDFKPEVTGDMGEFQNNFIYFNLQPISAIKAFIKEVR